MSATVDITEELTLAALRSFLLAILPAGVDVIVGQSNRVPEPMAGDFVVQTAFFKHRLSTNRTTYADGRLTDPVAGAGQRQDTVPQQVTVQLDFHGPSSYDNATIVEALWRSDAGVDGLAISGLAIAPLYASDPRQAPFLNGEQQVEQCWQVDLVMQCNPVITTGQDFAASLEVGLINVDREFPPA
ncbi:MAG TPA: hypothetical protein VF453_06580 [Burkholderiaceae bacterium]